MIVLHNQSLKCFVIFYTSIKMNQDIDFFRKMVSWHFIFKFLWYMNYNQTIQVILIKDVKSLFWNFGSLQDIHKSPFWFLPFIFSNSFQAQIDYISLLRMQAPFLNTVTRYQVLIIFTLCCSVFDTTIRTVISYNLFWYVVEIMDIALYILKVALNSFLINHFYIQ